MTMPATTAKLDAFTAAYITCALWSTYDYSNEQGGDPFDRNYSAADIAPETLAKMQADCAQFWEDSNPEICAAELTAEQAGHDFWLTRNHHGAGFFDRGLPEPVEAALMTAAHAFLEIDLYLGDDGRIHTS